MIAPRARVRRRPASSQPTPSSRRRDPSPLATARLAVTSNTRGDGADAERERVVAAVAAAERAQRARREASRARDDRCACHRATRRPRLPLGSRRLPPRAQSHSHQASVRARRRQLRHRRATCRRIPSRAPHSTSTSRRSRSAAPRRSRCARRRTTRRPAHRPLRASPATPTDACSP